MYIWKVFVFEKYFQILFFYVFLFVFEEFFEKVFIFVFLFAYWKNSDFKYKYILFQKINFWQVKVLHDVLMFLKFLKLMLLHK